MPNYPYVSGQVGVTAAFAQLRKGFPSKVDAGYLQRFNIAPANESYIISILRFLGLIDEDGNRVEDKTAYFFGNDEGFKTGLEGALRSAYSQVFDEMGESALNASRADLAHWFRAVDKTSDLVGQRQASTFQTLAALAGHGELPAARSGASAKKPAAANGPATKAAAKKAAAPANAAAPRREEPTADDGAGAVKPSPPSTGPDVGLTVRIEVNLPPGGDADTYDAIFASIKKHLMS